MTPKEASSAIKFADCIRLRAVKMISPHGFGYLGQALSSAELLSVLYTSTYRYNYDDIVCSPGHYIIAFFAAAAEKGYISEDMLDTYGFDGSDLEAIGTERSPAISLTSGSLGQGLSGAVGLALGHQLRKAHDKRVFALISDGELQEGQLWETALFASYHKMSNLVVFLDANDSQVDGPVSSITNIEPVAAKWQSFGWDAFDVDGHDVSAISIALRAALDSDKPSIIIGRTSTVHGLDALPDDADGHFIKLPKELAVAAIKELELRLA